MSDYERKLLLKLARVVMSQLDTGRRRQATARHSKLSNDLALHLRDEIRNLVIEVESRAPR